MNDQQLTTIFKTEYSNLIAVLYHYYQVQDIQRAEDIVSDTFLRAMKSWSHNGVPDNPKAWLRQVAVNILKDEYRRKKNYDENILPQLQQGENAREYLPISDRAIEDSQLQMIFVVCDPSLAISAQLCMALRILCGFSIEEIAKALLTNKEAINKRLYRAKQSIKAQEQLELELSQSAYLDRLDNVLRVIYLLFNEGYYSSINALDIREDMCWEAMRLAIVLSKQQAWPRYQIYALLALMCFHASRLNARLAEDNAYLLYHQQDRSKWDQALISKGEKYLHLASNGNKVSKYHIEAAIAYWHTTEQADKWNHILQLYNRLLTLEYSPIIAMNRTYALAQANNVAEAIQEAHKLDLADNHYYYCLLAELYRIQGDTNQEHVYLHMALDKAQKESERKLIREKLGR